MTSTSGDWNLGNEDDEVVRDGYNYEDDDEDEFGLPSIASYRRKTPGYKGYDPHGAVAFSSKGASLKVPFGRPRANSTDIAEERGGPGYPAAKKSEEKILRPQYKEILRG